MCMCVSALIFLVQTCSEFHQLFEPINLIFQVKHYFTIHCKSNIPNTILLYRDYVGGIMFISTENYIGKLSPNLVGCLYSIHTNNVNKKGMNR